MKKQLKWIIPLGILVLVMVGFFLYVEDFYHADEAAKEALISDGSVGITKTDYGWFFDGPSGENALIFYPGGKVEAEAYAPLCRALAESGIDVFLVQMPLRLAIFGQNKADGIIGSADYAHKYIGGHSLGGVCAAAYAAEHPDKLDGVILLASYSAKKLDDKLTVVLIRGSEDKVLNAEQYSKNMKNIPAGAVERIIEGGNHAQFGSYGVQSGDGKALISGAQQIRETVLTITEALSAGE